MKKHVCTILTTLIVLGFFSGCEKSDTKKDYSASIKDKTWWGTITYTGEIPEYYSIHYSADNSLIWSQLSGDFEGHWVINGNQVTITLNENATQITADITDDDKLMNFSDNTELSEVNTGELIKTPIVFLDNTAWAGSVINVNVNPTAITMNFTPDNYVEIEHFAQGAYNYSRSASGVVLRFYIAATFKFFGVIISGNEIRGSMDVPEYQFKVLKQ